METTNLQIIIEDNYNGACGSVEQRVLRNKSISKTARLIYSYLCSFADPETGECFPALSTILDELDMSKTTFYRYIKELEDLNLIRRTQRFGQSTVYKFIHYLQKFKERKQEQEPSTENTVDQKLAIPVDQKLDTEHNQLNITNNITNESKESKKDLSNNDKQLYLESSSKFLDKETKELIAAYALNDKNEFDIVVARKIEKAIFGAKKSATKELLKEKVLTTKDLEKENKIYRLSFTELNSKIYDVLKNVFYQLRFNRNNQKIKNAGKYLFGAMKKEFKDYIADLKRLSSNDLEVPIFNDMSNLFSC